jgi:hypothetical protein
MLPCKTGCVNCPAVVKKIYLGKYIHEDTMSFWFPIRAKFSRIGVFEPFSARVYWTQESSQMNRKFARLKQLPPHEDEVKLSISVPSIPNIWYPITVKIVDDQDDRTLPYFYLGRKDVYKHFCLLFIPSSLLCLLRRVNDPEQRRNIRLYPRKSRNKSVNWLIPSPNDTSGIIRVLDISESAVRVKSKRNYREDSPIEISVVAYGGKKEWKLSGNVLRVDPIPHQRNPTYDFVIKIDDQCLDGRALQQFVKETYFRELFK